MIRIILFLCYLVTYAGFAAETHVIKDIDGKIGALKAIVGDDGKVYIVYHELGALGLNDYLVNPEDRKIYKGDIKYLSLSNFEPVQSEIIAKDIYQGISSSGWYNPHLGIAASKNGAVAVSYHHYLGWSFAYDVFIAKKHLHQTTWEIIKTAESPANSGWFPTLLFDPNDDKKLSALWFCYGGYIPFFFTDITQEEYLSFPYGNGFDMHLRRSGDGTLWFVYQEGYGNNYGVSVYHQEINGWISESILSSAKAIGLSTGTHSLTVPMQKFRKDESEFVLYQRAYDSDYTSTRKIFTLENGESLIYGGNGWAFLEELDKAALLTLNIQTGSLAVYQFSVTHYSNWQRTEIATNIDPAQFGGASVFITPEGNLAVIYADGISKSIKLWRDSKSSVSEAPQIEVLEPSGDGITVTENVYPFAGTASHLGDTFHIEWQNKSLGNQGLCSNTQVWQCDVPLAFGENEIVIIAMNTFGSKEVITHITRVNETPGDAHHGIVVIINAAGSVEETGEYFDSIAQPINTLAVRVIKTLTALGISLQDIYYLGPDDLDIDGKPGLDGILHGSPEQDENWNKAVDWANVRLKDNTPIYILFMGHGDRERFLIEPHKSSMEKTSIQLSNFIDDFKQTVPIYIFVEACYSGSLMSDLRKAGRLVVTSSAPNQRSVMTKSGIPSFSYLLWRQILRGQSIGKAFEVTRKSLLSDDYKYVFSSSKYPQEPQLEDGMFKDIPLSNTKISEDFIVTPGVPPTISDVTVEEDGNIRCRVQSGNEILRTVWATIIPPDFLPLPADQTTGIAYDSVPRVNLLPIQDGYLGRFKGFVKQGTYQIMLYAENTDGDVSNPVTVPFEILENSRVNVNLDLPHTVKRGGEFKVSVTRSSNGKYDEYEYDEYEAVMLPDGNITVIGDYNLFLGGNRVEPFSKRTITLSTQEQREEMIVSLKVNESIPIGKYLWYSVFVPPGGNPFNQENWLGEQIREFFVE